MTRFAIHLLLRKAVERASSVCGTLKKKRVSPHVVRHGTAMALLQSGVDIAVIALWLGHESIETTNLYVHANLALKEKALAKVARSARDSVDSVQTIPCWRSQNRFDEVGGRGVNQASPISRFYDQRAFGRAPLPSGLFAFGQPLPRTNTAARFNAVG
jgi:hypothetical protein